MFLTIVVVFCVCMLTACGGKKNKYGEFVWPSSEAAAQLPVPESTTGEISLDKEDYLSVYVADISKEQYDEYVNQCKEKGFTLDYSNSDSYYMAKNENGYSLYLSYDERRELMDISVSKRSDDSEDESEGTEDSLYDDSSDYEDSYDEIEDEDDIENEDDDDDEEEDDDDEVNPKLKKALDAYEKFMDKYIKFMKKYTKDPIKYMDEYADMLNEYTKEMEAIEDMDQDDFSKADAAYYLEVTSRVAAKLAKLNE